MSAETPAALDQLGHALRSPCIEESRMTESTKAALQRVAQVSDGSAIADVYGRESFLSPLEALRQDLRFVLTTAEERAAKGEEEYLREALDGYRAAASWIGADSWDGCSDCVAWLKAALAADWRREPASPDKTAKVLNRLRPHKPDTDATNGRLVHQPNPASDAGRKEVPALVGKVIELALRDIARTQTDFLGRMELCLSDYEAVFDEYPDGDLEDGARADADEAITGLAALALAQVAMLRHPDAPSAALKAEAA